MLKQIRIAGQGGQGIIKAGEILGRAFLYDNKNVIQSQSYGSEARGGSCKTDILLSDEEVNDFIAFSPDIFLLLSKEAFEKNKTILKKAKIVIVDETIELPKTKGKIYKIPIIKNTIANKLSINVFSLGILCSLTNIISKSALEKSIKNSFSGKFVNENLKAMREGYELGRFVLFNKELKKGNYGQP